MKLVRALPMFLLLAACGGGPSGPGPLRHTLDDMHIAAVPLDSKAAVINAKQELDLAKMERAKAESDLSETKLAVSRAKNEAEQARLDVKSAEQERKAAAKSYDVARKNNSERELRTAQLGARVADAKVSFLKAKTEWLKKVVRYTAHNVYAKEAKYELEKARVAQRNNIKPPGFDLANYEKQYTERSKAAQRQQAAVNEQRKKAEKKRQDWNAKEKEYMAAKGVTGTPESAKASLDWRETRSAEPVEASTRDKAKVEDMKKEAAEKPEPGVIK